MSNMSQTANSEPDKQFTTRKQVEEHLTSVCEDLVSDFVNSLQKGDLPITVEQLEADFSSFTQGYLEPDEEDEPQESELVTRIRTVAKSLNIGSSSFAANDMMEQLIEEHDKKQSAGKS